MAVLSDIDLKAAIKNNEGIIITGLQESSITAVGYDLTIGFLCDVDEGKPLEIDPKTGRFCLQPNRRYLIISAEYIALPNSYIGTLHSRISYVTKGLVIPSTTVDPNFEGFIFSVLINCSGHTVWIKEHSTYLTMVIHRLQTPTKMFLQTNDDSMPRDGYSSVITPFSNFHPDTVSHAKAYCSDSIQKIRVELREAQQRHAKKLQEQQDAVLLKENQTEAGRLLADMQAQLDAMQKEMDENGQQVRREKRSLKWVIAGLSVLCAVLLFWVLYSIWGIKVWTVLASLIPILMAVPSFLADWDQLKKLLKKE